MPSKVSTFTTWPQILASIILMLTGLIIIFLGVITACIGCLLWTLWIVALGVIAIAVGAILLVTGENTTEIVNWVEKCNE